MSGLIERDKGKDIYGVSQSASCITLDSLNLPLGWRQVRLDEICERRTGICDPRTEPAKQFKYVDISSVDNVAKRIIEPKILLGKDAPSRARQIIREGDVLVSTTRPNLNAVALVPPQLNDEVCSTGFCVLRVTHELRADYLFAFVQSKEFIQPLSDLVKGALYPAVTDNQVRAQSIPLPPLPEQKRIATILKEQMAAVERARAAAEAQLEAAKKLPNIYLDEAFYGITPLTTNPIPDEAPEGWNWHLLGDLARLESGHTPSRYHPEWWGGNIAWIALPDIRKLDGKTAFETSEYTNELGIANSSARILPTGTVCLSRTASVGFVTVMGKPMATSQDFVNWICGSDLDHHFLALLLRASRKFIHSVSSGAVHKTVYMPTVKSFRVCIPSIDEQKQIASTLRLKLEYAEHIQLTLQDQLNSINELPALLLRQAFTGKL